MSSSSTDHHEGSKGTKITKNLLLENMIFVCFVFLRVFVKSRHCRS